MKTNIASKSHSKAAGCLAKQQPATTTSNSQIRIRKTYAGISKTSCSTRTILRRAKAKGQPYHIIHFDGHGAFLNMEKLFRTWKKNTDEEMMKQMAELLKIDRDRFSLSSIYPRTPRRGDHGYLIIETDATVLVLNACRSSYANPLSAPATDKPAEGDPHAHRYVHLAR